MAKKPKTGSTKKSKSTFRSPHATKRPRAAALPGMEDHAIKPLEDIAEEYAEIRDHRMDLTEREHALKIHALRLMKKYEKTIYRHNGVEIAVIPGEEDVKVKVKKPSDDDAESPRRLVEHVGEAETIDVERDAYDVEQSDERRDAVDEGES